ncbi:MAG: Peptidyl-prolyl cis-trans isomerase [uncultured Chloroflexia bacterium]|uniref:Peptidyl-prolyl cis-trans isomerase n=1 Tax=uncultured Chloroflexia bacterium TaxID=1672391 RepID=A0A6J4JHV3_9CHLR|nr:MAG: Peptidyl-prolyl cis-trans isomerase [uncultured Chloroflexia bacterium]
MHMLRYWTAIVMLVVLAACGTPTSTTLTATEAPAITAPETTTTPEEEVVPEATAGAEEGTSTEATTASGGAQPAGKQYAAAPAMSIDANKTYTAAIETTKGTIRAELYAKDTPMTVNNFVFLARDGFYNDVKFHRIIKGFMVQTGDPQGDGTGGPGYSFEDEPVTREYERGTLAMANSGPNTNGSQFFIVHEATGLPKNYTIFGKVTEGLDVLDAIANVPVETNPMTQEASDPQEEVLIKGITIEES